MSGGKLFGITFSAIWLPFHAHFATILRAHAANFAPSRFIFFRESFKKMPLSFDEMREKAKKVRERAIFKPQNL